MAPYAIAHLKVGLKLYETGYRFGSDERARIYLTNALEPAQDFSGTFEFAIPALAHEAQAVNEVKRKQRFTVVIGNPPYSNLSANLTPSARSLVARYKQIDGKPLIERNALQLERNVNDDYIKFFALGEDVLSASERAVFSMITNSSFLDAQTLRGLRARIVGTWERVLVTDLGGSGDLSGSARAASADDNVFDIQQAVAITTVLRKHKPKERVSAVGYARVMGTREFKYAQLIGETAISLHQEDTPALPPMFLFIPSSSMDGWDEFVALTELLPAYAEGLKTGFDELLMTFTEGELRDNLEALADNQVTSASLRERYGIADKGWANQLLVNRRTTGLRAVEAIEVIRRVHYRPLDHRFCPIDSPLVKAPSRVAGRHMRARHSLCLLAARQVAGLSGVTHFLVSRAIPDNRCFYSKKGSVTYFPLYADDSDLAGTSNSSLIRESVRKQFSACLGIKFQDGHGDEDRDGLSPRTLVAYWYAIFHSPAYRERYESRLKTDFPRVPLPGGLDLFSALARLGGDLVALHLLESPKLDDVRTTYTGPKNPEVGRVGWSNDTVWLDAAATKKGQTTAPGAIGFRGVPEAVWNFHIGGYQVCEKWLKVRKGRTLSKDDIAHYQKIVVALNETIRLMHEIDAVIEQHGGWPGAFQTGETQSAAPKVTPFRPRIVQPGPKERYVTCVPLVPLKVAAGAFSDPQHIDDDGFEWAVVETKRRVRPGMFVAQVVGKSMEPAIPDGAYCLFAAPVEGTRHGKTVLVQLRDATDPESGERYTVKRYASEKAPDGDRWRHDRITLHPLNPDFQPIVLTGSDEEEFQVIAEFLEALGSDRLDESMA